MEKRTNIEIEQTNQIFFEAVIKHKEKGTVQTFTQKRLDYLQSDLDVWLKCGKYELVSAEKVERVMTKLIESPEELEVLCS